MESVSDLTLVPASRAELDAVFRLLSDSHLPVADLEAHLDAFVLAKCAGSIVGSVGLEIYGELALLRSLCVAKPHRAKRIGVALVSAVLARAATLGVRQLYLLTTDVAPYFEKLGFSQLARAQVPSEIRSTAQFTSLCPSSAVCLQRVIAPVSQT